MVQDFRLRFRVASPLLQHPARWQTRARSLVPTLVTVCKRGSQELQRARAEDARPNASEVLLGTNFESFNL